MGLKDEYRSLQKHEKSTSREDAPSTHALKLEEDDGLFKDLQKPTMEAREMVSWKCKDFSLEPPAPQNPYKICRADA